MTGCCHLLLSIVQRRLSETAAVGIRKRKSRGQRTFLAVSAGWRARRDSNPQPSDP